jgi:putative endonuclease
MAGYRWPWRCLLRWRMRRKDAGARGEQLAARFLRRQGMIVVGRNERFGRAEIDLVAIEGRRRVVFVEVKTRRGSPVDHPADSVTMEKQRHLTRAALAYLKRHHLLECPVRFDVVTVTLPVGARRPQIRHYRGAFEPEGPAGNWG